MGTLFLMWLCLAVGFLAGAWWAGRPRDEESFEVTTEDDTN